ncbi:MAG TPA: regulatory protein RecX [Pseudorhizobium sp.]|nr:regulatory protein RecX [Pseudorhizobium sp.]
MQEHDQLGDDPTVVDAVRPTARMLAWAKNSAAYRLSRRMMTEQELKSAIIRKAKQKFEGISEAELLAVVEYAIDFGHRTGALDDKSYAEAKVRSSTRDGKSRRLIARKLQEKGVSKETAAIALEDADDWLAAISFARKRGFGPFRRMQPDEKRMAKELSAFARSGFSFELARRVLDMSVEDTDAVLAEKLAG